MSAIDSMIACLHNHAQTLIKCCDDIGDARTVVMIVIKIVKYHLYSLKNDSQRKKMLYAKLFTELCFSSWLT